MSVRIVEIDEQHKGWLELVNYLYHSMRDGRSQEALALALKEMVDYSNNHFATEERLMKKYHYPHLELHRNEHESFRAKVRGYVENYNKGNMVLAIDVVQFMSTWIFNHIRTVDKGYSNYLIDKGIIRR